MDTQPAARPPEAIDDQPAARLPTAAVAPKPKPAATVEQRVAQPGDRICGSCGEPNDPARKFCRRCGAGLGEAKIVAATKLPWWRRIFAGASKPSKQYAAGERIDPMQKGSVKVPGKGGIRGILKGIGLVRGALVLVVAIGIFGYVGIPSFQGIVNGAVGTVRQDGVTGVVDGIRKFFAPTLEAERPVAIAATSELDGHAATRMFDTFFNTDWQGNDKAPSITVSFDQPVDLGAVIVYPGNSEAFVDLRRPSKLAFDFPDGTSTTIDLEDVKDKQQFDLSANKVDAVTIRILATNGPESAPISISEIEFFKKG